MEEENEGERDGGGGVEDKDEGEERREGVREGRVEEKRREGERERSGRQDKMKECEKEGWRVKGVEWKDRMMEREGEERDGGDGVEDRRENQDE